jgi:hypothetical protein
MNVSPSSSSPVPKNRPQYSIWPYKTPKFIIALFFPYGSTPPRGLRPPHFSRLRDHTWDSPHSVGLLWTSVQPVAETSTWQQTTFTRERHPCPRRDSNPQSQQASGLRPHGHWDRHNCTYPNENAMNNTTEQKHINLTQIQSTSAWYKIGYLKFYAFYLNYI